MCILHDVDFTEEPHLVYACGACQAEAHVDLRDLLLGTEFNVNVIVLPKCPCGAQSFLQRTWDTHDGAETTHRKATNAVAQWLKENGRSHPNCAAEHAREEKTPRFIMDRAGRHEDVSGKRVKPEVRSP